MHFNMCGSWEKIVVDAHNYITRSLDSLHPNEQVSTGVGAFEASETVRDYHIFCQLPHMRTTNHDFFYSQ